jgi:hypothetical protein
MIAEMRNTSRSHTPRLLDNNAAPVRAGQDMHAFAHERFSEAAVWRVCAEYVDRASSANDEANRARPAAFSDERSEPR